MKDDQERVASSQQKPSFPPSYYQEGEVDLVALFRVLAKRKITIISITLLTIFIAITYALTAPSIYESKSILLPPTEKQVEFFGLQSIQGAQSAVSVEKAFNTFRQHLYSDRRQVFDSMNLIEVYGTKGNSSDDAIFAQFNESFTLKVAQEKKGTAYFVPTTSLSLQGNDPGLIADILNQLVAVASENSKNELITNISEKLNSRKEALSRTVTQLKENYSVNNQDKTDRLVIESKFKQESIRNNIAVLLNKAVSVRKDRIEMLLEHAVIARDAGIIFGSEQRTVGRNVEVNIERALPLYLRGEKVLLAEAKQLEQRKSDEAFIPELKEFKAKLLLLDLELQTELDSLRVKSTEDAFVAGLRAYEVELRQLNKFDFTRLQLGSVANISQAAFPPEAQIKPKRSLIVILAAILGLMMGIFGAFFLHFIENQKKEEE